MGMDPELLKQAGIPTRRRAGAGGPSLKKVESPRATGKKDEPEAIEPVLVRMGTVKPQEVSWLWYPYIPLGKLTVLEGDPSVGKTYTALQLVAIVTRGDPFPGLDGIPRGHSEPGTAIYLTGEDGLADTLRPRLDAAGADVDRVYALTGAIIAGKESGVTLSDLAVFNKVFSEIRPKLVVIDPLQAYLGADVDLHRANEVRPILAGLSKLAEAHGAAILLIRHLGKGQQAHAIYRGLGSIDIAAAARSILLAGKDPGDEANRVLAHVKSSLAPAGPSLCYSLGPNGFLWGGISQVTPEQLLAPPRDEEEKDRLAEAVEFLKEELADGPQPSSEIFKAAKKAGIAIPTLRRAQKKIGIAARKTGEGWIWSMDTVDDHLDHLPENRVDTEFPATNQDDQVIILNGSRKAKSGKGLSQVDQDDHQNLCPVCRGANWWTSKAGVPVCRVCHPPAPGAELVSE